MHDSTNLDLHSLRAQKARLAVRWGHAPLTILQIGMAAFGVLALAIAAASEQRQTAFLAVGCGLACMMIWTWYRHDISDLPVEGNSLTGRLDGKILGQFNPTANLSTLYMWRVVSGHWQTIFILNHLLLTRTEIENEISQSPQDPAVIWQQAVTIANQAKSQIVEPGHIATAILMTTPSMKELFSRLRLGPHDVEHVANWLDRVLVLGRLERPFFGGIGRDWANGFTPMLNRFGHSLSADIEASQAHFGSLTDSPGVNALQNSFTRGAHGVAIIGPDGIGKTSHIYALAQLLLEGKAVPTLAYNQIIGLNPSVIISSAQHTGELEQVVLTLLSEASHAGHIILFLDDAQLFFGEGPGSFDMTQILLPVMQNGSVRLILAMSPSDYQRLKAKNSAFANLLSPVVLTELPEAEVMEVLEDSALGLEHQRGLMISYEALREAYRLSGRYEQDLAYPGKAIQLLEQSLSHAHESGIITARSVQKAVEQARGVKVGAAAPLEADALLHLEDAIHQRMINQSRAVKVVASALRRSRAGVSNPKRPIGSFLFLGPTGVGKTELAKAIAATYFSDEKNMVRLDMSEYQQPDDVQRLLDSGEHASSSLILAVRQQPFTVLLFDEIEKAHPNILNLFLQLLDEGQLTDSSGRPANFKDCIIIATSNAGADSIRQRIEQGQELESFEKEFTDQLINSGQFKPELLNRFDEIVLFRPLKPEELAQVVRLMLGSVNQTLANQNISVELTDAAIAKIVEVGNDPRLGARPMRRALQRAVEDGIAGRILRGETQPGDHVMLDVNDLAL